MGSAPNYTVLGRLELTAMQVVRFDIEERLGQDYVYLAGSGYTGPDDYFTRVHDRCDERSGTYQPLKDKDGPDQGCAGLREGEVRSGISLIH